MQAPSNIGQPCFSTRLVLPFVRLLRRDPRVPVEALSHLEALDPDERIPIATVHELLTGAVFLTGDPDIGLKAAREIVPGEYGALEYAARSAPTWGDACQAVGRYMRLVNDALRFSVHTEADRAFIQLDSTVPLPRTAADFQSAAFQISAGHLRAPDFSPAVEAWFMHPEPDSVVEYEITFPATTLRFGAAFNGFVVAREVLTVPLPSADPKLHTLITKHADAMLRELPAAQSLTERVRALLTQELTFGAPSLGKIARHVGMSERTLSRHLEEEGASFKVLLEEVRRRLALRYVHSSDLQVAEIAFLLGFSQAAAFHRAFRRWTGQTPRDYRRAARNLPGSEGR